MRCHDLGFVPWVSSNGDNHVKLWGAPFLSRFFSKMQVGASLAKVSLETSLDELCMQSLRPVLVHRCIQELQIMEGKLGQPTTVRDLQAEIESKLEAKDSTVGDLYRAIALYA